MRISQDGNVVTLINVFETTPEKQQALIDQWVRFTEAVRTEPGYIGTALHKSTDGTRVINYAHWRSQADFEAFPIGTGQTSHSFSRTLRASIRTHMKSFFSTSPARGER